MYYTRLKPDIEKEEAEVLQKKFGFLIYDDIPLQLAENSQLSFTNTAHIPLDEKGKLLLFNPKLATWVFLEGREQVLCDYLREGIQFASLLVASQLKINGLGGKERLNKMLSHLYARGMLAVDGKTGINQEIYRQGPLFEDVPMMELLVTKRCNLGCSYCFAEAGSNEKDMEPGTALAAVDRLMEMPSNYYYIKFSGGEPLLRKELLGNICCHTLEKLQKKEEDGFLLFEITTNGTLIDKESIELFKRYNMRVLISIDGPAPFHNQGRPYPGGKPSFPDVIRGIKRMQDAVYPFRVITVVSRQHLQHTGEIIDFFAANGINNLRFNPVLENGRGKTIGNQQTITPGDYLEFMKTAISHGTIHDIVFCDDNIASLLRNLVYKGRNFKCMRSNCGCGSWYFCIDTDGTTYPCAYNLSETQYMGLGNVHNGINFQECRAKHPLIKNVHSRNVEKIEICSQCCWRHLCEGGCTIGAYLSSGKLLSPTYLCDYFKGMYEFIFEKLAQHPGFIEQHLPGEVKLECL